MAGEKKDKGYTEAEWNAGVKIEYEHQPTYDMIKKTLEETGELPEAIKVFESITNDHLSEFPNYYNDEVGLPNLERELKAMKPNIKEEKEISDMLDEGKSEDEIVSKILGNSK